MQFPNVGDALLDQIEDGGEMPLPPYIARKRAVDSQDSEDYQTVFAQERGAVAAPTASLHFTTELLDALVLEGVKTAWVTLHVGAGTFLPVKADSIDDHKMHSEWTRVGRETVDSVKRTRSEGGRVVAVGTTALRALETAAAAGGVIDEWEGETDIFIRPGYDFRVVDGLITNFHLPKSTLLMLVSALMGTACVQEIYAHAIDQRYRFYSYGDSSLLLPRGRQA